MSADTEETIDDIDAEADGIEEPDQPDGADEADIGVGIADVEEVGGGGVVEDARPECGVEEWMRPDGSACVCGDGHGRGLARPEQGRVDRFRTGVAAAIGIRASHPMGRPEAHKTAVAQHDCMQSLVIVAHGSHLNPDASTPTYDHADTIREAGVFDEVRTGFWKEEPSFREVLRTVESDEVYVVPLFISEGYFTEEVIPRELRLEGWDLEAWDSDGTSATHATFEAADVEKTVHYCGPVGTHDAMSDVIVRRAESVTGDPEVGEGVALAVVGHGTERNENSAKAVELHADRIDAMDRFEEVEALFMDEDPEVDDVTEFFETEDIVVVPLFVADGYHTQEDIPEDMGLTEDYRTGWETPAEVEGHRIWYAGAVGTEALTADVLIERAADAGADVGDAIEEVRRKTRNVGTAGDAGTDTDAGAGAEAGD